jgi:tetratricopeptide (TPR) repeat protein
LQPQEPVAAPEPTPAVPETGSSTSALDYFATAKVEPYAPTKAQQQAELEADSGLEPKPRSTPSAAPAEIQPAAASVPPVKEPVIGGGTHGKLKIGLDEKQSAAIEAKKKLAARNAAKSVFDAKQKSPNRRAIAIGLLGLTILCVGGAYFYMSIIGIGQPVQTNLVAVATPVQTAPETPLPSDADALPPSGEAQIESPVGNNTNAVVENRSPAPSSDTAALPGTTRLALMPQERSALQSPQAVVPAADRNFPAAAKTSSTAAPFARTVPSAQPQLSSMASQSDAIQIRRTDASLQLNPALSGAYKSYMAGDLGAAHTQYQQVLQQEPGNRDALLGIAAIAVNRGQNAQASAFYNRLLELDPNDAEATAGIASLDQNDPSRTESRLKKILAKNPNSGSTLFALGNVYAEQSRWSEAQQFYFRAFGATSGNADYAYNLAISLDKLDQNRLALEYYQRALELSHKSGGNLNKATVINRIQSLQSMPQS